MSEQDTQQQAQADLEALKKSAAEAEELKKRYADAERKLTEIATENATLAKRMRETEGVKQAEKEQGVQDEFSRLSSEIMVQYANDPEKIGKEFGKLLHKAKTKAQQDTITDIMPKINEYIDNANLVRDIRTSNPELLKHENIMRPRIEQLVRDGKSPKDAINQTIEEFKPLMQAQKPVATPVIPRGATGANGVNVATPGAVASPDNKVETRDGVELTTEATNDYIAERRAMKNKKAFIK